MPHLLVDVEEELNMPGGVGFIDMTESLNQGTADMEVGAILTVDGFTLQDAMSALQIMDPRMDTGMVDLPPPFDPHTPLLPSEVCWILDRSFACEMSWHTGLALSQTVYTLQYVHHFNEFDGRSKRTHHASKDPQRPIELVTLVLKAGVIGLLKCCDMVWRELANDHLVDGEDWNGEKFGVSLCEAVQPEVLMKLIDEAINWLQQSPSLSSPWRSPLLQRIFLRKNILQTLLCPSLPALPAAKLNLEVILAGIAPPEPPAAIQHAFDPAISRRLVTFVPTRVIEMPPQTEVWETISMWLDGWQEVHDIIGPEDLRSLKVLSNLRAYEGQSPRRSAFLRSLSISTFFNGQKILRSHDPPWLIDRFFWEMAAVDAAIFSQMDGHLLDASDTSTPSPDDEERDENQRLQKLSGFPPQVGYNVTELFEKGLAKLLLDQFSSYFHNRARQRRRLSASLLDWHLAFDQATVLATRLSSSFPSNLSLGRIPLCIRHTRISVITDVVLTGFELELYTLDEWVIMYWYAQQLLTAQLGVLKELDASISRDREAEHASEARAYVSYQLEYTEALRCISIAMRDILYRYAPAKAKIDPSREQANFERRFKWAFLPGYSEAALPDEDKPVLSKWRAWRHERQAQPDEETLGEASKTLARARESISRLSECEISQSGAGFCPETYRKFMEGLVRVCDANLTFLKMSPEIREVTGRHWHWISSRWFPEAGVHNTS